MPKETVLVELYAGMAALSLWFSAATPIVGRRGSKRGYAAAIAERLAGGAKPDRFVLNDADPEIANTLGCMSDRPREIAEFVRSMAASDAPPYARWRELVALPPADNPAERAARWLLISAGSAMGDASSGLGMSPSRVCLNAYELAFVPKPEEIARRLESLPPLAWEVRHGPAETLDPIPGAIAYLDPPYAGTPGYRTTALLPPRKIAERWARAGCRVGLSETLIRNAPLGWKIEDLTATPGSRRNREMIRLAGRRELLFVSP